MQVPQLPVCGLHVTVAAWFPHVSTSVCTTEEEEVEIMKYRNLWKRGSFRKRACLTEIPRIMEKWQKGKHGKGIVKQPVTETFFLFCFSLSLSLWFHREPPREHKSPNVQNVNYEIAFLIKVTYNQSSISTQHLSLNWQSAHLDDSWIFFRQKPCLSHEIRWTQVIHANGRKGFTVYKKQLLLEFCLKCKRW